MMPLMEDIQVVVMMGGVGSRLGSLVADCPKPLLPVGKYLPGLSDTGEKAAPEGVPFFEYE